ncbi:TPA: class B sortase [Streptococcus pyogenes]|uniref:class B sortase n=1 Tax=Streptococcus pyogenes TaxID=1314 RepID=UPI000252E7D6|nr:class B sortase [Streptococcus pyogenes]HER4563660.1 class B sortase [Streptococcus pyogenes NGAS639]HER4649180.1 class B sortase [Streptococcus pyogenes NGAS465]HER4659304.1 class B sortase [Streptococcus pyogenes NGAS440]HER4697677.1 class B sortase [Streptococcus pyogenes NGAS339]HER4709214.1 class B sortase [Streptococcus pyogenes NGAS321]HER4818703.1 class B sortase [Streptococcus pyogenes NGAS008]
MMMTIVQVINKAIDTLILIFCLVVLFLAGFGLWDSYHLYQQADASNFKKFKTAQQQPKFEDLLALNDDVIGWLNIPGTHIDYPLVQGKTNLEYINKAVDGSVAMSGSLFLDTRNHNDFTDDYSLIYGHHMAGNAMFGEIPKFLKKDFFNKHNKAIIETKERKKLTVTIFACLKTDAFDQLVFNPNAITNQDQQRQLVDYISKRSKQFKPVKLKHHTKFVAFSTCENFSTDNRVIVVGTIQE